MAGTEDDPALTVLITSARSGCADAVEHAVRGVDAAGLKLLFVEPLIEILNDGRIIVVGAGKSLDELRSLELPAASACR